MSDRLALGRLPRLLRRPRARPFVRRFSKLFTRLERRLVRSGRATIGGWVAGGAPVLLLTTTGRRSGKRHVTPLLYHPEVDGSLLVIAANGAADWNPDWFHNLVADPQVDVDVDGVKASARAAVLESGDREAAWPAAVQAFPGPAAAQRDAKRGIPLVRLTID